MDTKRLRKFARRYMARQKLRAKDEELTKWIVNEQKELIEHLVDEGVGTFALPRDGVTIFTKTLIWARMKKPKAQVISALKDCVETRDLVDESFNSARLSSYLRELDKDDKEIPEQLKDFIEADPVSNLIAKKI